MLHPAFEDRKMFTVYILCLIFEPSRFSYQYSCALVSNKTQKKIGTRLKFARADASRGYLMIPNGRHIQFKILVSCNGFEIARDVLLSILNHSYRCDTHIEGPLSLVVAFYEATNFDFMLQRFRLSLPMLRGI